MSRRALRGERAVHTLNPTALVHEVYLRLANLKKVSWENRKPFFAFTARLMRHVLVEHARAANAQNRIGWGQRIDLELDELPNGNVVDTLALDDLLTRLDAQDPQLARIIELRVFSGFKELEVAEALEVSRSTVQREWRIAKRLLAELLGATHQ
jgi:RNA polymerase sigma factor (TIGR02999 family)